MIVINNNDNNQILRENKNFLSRTNNATNCYTFNHFRKFSFLKTVATIKQNKINSFVKKKKKNLLAKYANNLKRLKNKKLYVTNTFIV